MRMRDFDEALNVLDSVRIKAAAEEDDEILLMAYSEEIIYHIVRDDYPSAIKLAEQLLQVDVPKSKKAEILYETGNFYLELNQLEDALKYFERVEDYSPVYIVELNSLIEKGRTLRKLGRSEEALEIFEEMRLEDKYRDNFDIIDYEIGMSYLALDKTEAAIENLTFVDTSYATSLYSGLARYNLGKIYEDNLTNFDSASVYYQKAASSQVPADMVKEVQGRNRLFNKYKSLSGKVSEIEKQIFYIDNPEEFTKDSSAYYDSLKSITAEDSINSGLEPVTRGRDRTQTQTQTQPNVNLKKAGPPVKPNIPRDSLKAGLLRNRFDLANLFFAEMNKPDSAAKYYSNILLDTSAAEYYSRSLYALGSYYQVAGDSVKADSIFIYLYDNYKSDKVVNAAAVQLNKPLINLSFDSAEGIFTTAENYWKNEQPDSALIFYRQVYEDHPKSSFAPKALLASGIILENDLKNLDSAAVLYDSVFVKYPGTQYAQNISTKLIAYKQEQMRIQREIEDSIRVANQKLDSLNRKTEPVVIPDSLSEVERLKKEMEGMDEQIPEDQVIEEDSLQIEEVKKDTLQQNIQVPNNNERRNPRRRK
jgi:tetratricopeptide (TPR) repeat protein